MSGTHTHPQTLIIQTAARKTVPEQRTTPLPLPLLFTEAFWESELIFAAIFFLELLNRFIHNKNVENYDYTITEQHDNRHEGGFITLIFMAFTLCCTNTVTNSVQCLS